MHWRILDLVYPTDVHELEILIRKEVFFKLLFFFKFLFFYNLFPFKLRLSTINPKWLGFMLFLMQMAMFTICRRKCLDITESFALRDHKFQVWNKNLKFFGFIWCFHVEQKAGYRLSFIFSGKYTNIWYYMIERTWMCKVLNFWTSMQTQMMIEQMEDLRRKVS